MELARACVIQHAQVDIRILVAGEADIAHLARLLCIEHGLHCATVGKDAVGVFQADHLVELHQVDAIGLQAAERLVDLLRGGCPGAAVDLGHEKNFVAVAALEGLAHADFADAAVVIPAVVHEGDAAIDGLADELNGILLLERWFADVVAAQPDGRNAFAGAAKGSIDHSAGPAVRSLLVRAQHRREELLCGGCACRRRRRLQEISPLHDPSRSADESFQAFRIAAQKLRSISSLHLQ